METKLWQKERIKTPAWLEEFTAGNDKTFDLLLAEYDVKGSMAHAAMLAHVGLITKEENLQLQKELQAILKTILAGSFFIEPGVEDVHSQIEFILTRKLGAVGKKIHTARSRNDQVLLDIKLFVKAELEKTALQVKELFDLLLSLSEQYKKDLLPGYTHLQVAMPSSFGLWFAAYAESLSDDLEMILAAHKIADKNPLGSGAGYGSSLPIDRSFTTKELHFSSMNHNVVYAQMTRGKTEKIAATALSSVAATLSKLSGDVCLFLSQNFNFISFPEELTTGSSIMPHKKNPDVFELIRARCNRIQALPNELTLLINNLPSGYHRDFQLSKECLFPAFKNMHDCLQAATFMLKQIIIKEDILKDTKYKYIFSVENVNVLVKQGLAFREAYKLVGEQIESDTFEGIKELQHTHEGSLGNLMNDAIRKEFYAKYKFPLKEN
jgi:argininosuccinate lyase